MERKHASIFFAQVAAIFRSKITIVFSIGFKLYYKIEFDELFENVSDISKINKWIYKIFK
jgi:hypothetical protein